MQPLRHPLLALALFTATVCAGGCAGRTVAPANGSAEPSPSTIVAIEDLPEPLRKPVPEGFKPKVPPMITAPRAKSRPLPIYPAELLGARVECEAELLNHVLKDGSVKLVRLTWLKDPGEQYRAVFENALRQAIGSWKYLPALQHLPTKMPDDSTKLVSHPIPKAARVRITFTVTGGKGTVSLR